MENADVLDLLYVWEGSSDEEAIWEVEKWMELQLIPEPLGNAIVDLRQEAINKLHLLYQENVTEWNCWISEFRTRIEDIVDELDTQDGFEPASYEASWRFRLDFDSIQMGRPLDLTGIDLRDIVISKKSNARLVLDNADLRGISLEGSQMKSCQVIGARLNRAYLSRCDFRYSDLRRSQFEESDMTGVNLLRANMTGASLRFAQFRDAILTHTVLDEADLRGASNLIFDENSVKSTRFNGGTQFGGAFFFFLYEQFNNWEDDRWSVLRREYTGARFALRVIALFLFLIPYILELVWLVSLGAIQREFISSMANIQIDYSLSGLAPANIALNYIESQEQSSIWEILLGTDRRGVWQTFVVLALTVSALIRYLLLHRVIPLRDSEDRSQVTPGEFDYRHLFVLHMAAYYIGWIGLGVFIYNIWKWMSTTVYLP